MRIVFANYGGVGRNNEMNRLSLEEGWGDFCFYLRLT